MSEVQYPDNVAAGGRVTGATAALQDGARGISGVTRVSAGVYNVSLAEQLDQVEYVAVASLLGTTGGIITCTPQSTDGRVQVRTFTGGLSGSGWSPEVIGSIDGLTVPGTPTFTGSGITAISSSATGRYQCTLAQAIVLANGAGCEGVVHVSPVQGDGADPPGPNVASIIRYEPIDATHITFFTQSNMLTAKDANFGLSIWRFNPAPTSPTFALVAADLDFAVSLFRINVANGQ